MQTLRKSHGAEVVVRCLRHASIALRTREDTAGHAPPVDATREDVGATREAWQQALEERVVQTAIIEWTSDKCDDLVMALSREALVLVEGSRSDARWDLLFPIAPSEVIEKADTAERLALLRRLASLAGGDPDFAPLQPYAGRLAVAATDLETAVSRRVGLEGVETTARAQFEASLDRARAVYNGLWHLLSLQFPDDEALVDSFFLRVTKEKEKEEEKEPAGEVTEAA